jgi:predicted DNA-binding transcriptional regulator AlpA
MDRYLTTKAVCERLNISRQTLHRWTTDPENDFPRPVCIGSPKRGGKRGYSEKALIRWAETRAVASAR